MHIKSLSFSLVLVCFFHPAIVFADEVVRLPTREEVTQAFFYMKAESPRANVILFPGGKGKLKLGEEAEIRKGKNNFLVRSRELFRGHQFNVAILDAPSDRQGANGMLYGFRTSAEHVQDIRTVVSFLRRQAGVPTWLIGTSRGTESAAFAGVQLGKGVDGIVLTASITEPNQKGDAVTELDLEKILVPVLVVSHYEDECWVTPPSGANAIVTRLKASPLARIRLFEGGLEPVSAACQARSAHGFYGLEKNVVDYISEFIKSPAI